MLSEQQHRNDPVSLDNYEEFFILYIDQELSDANRKAVETFLEEHPELQEEMDQLQLTKFVPEKLPSLDKSSLLRNNIDASNVESYQLLLIDDELDADTAAKVMDYMSENPEANTNWQLLQKAKLQDEKIIFPYKNDLIKKNTGKIPALRWTSISIAASLILFLGLGISFFQKNIKEQSGIPIATGRELPKSVSHNSSIDSIVTASTTAKSDKDFASNQTAIKKYPKHNKSRSIKVNILPDPQESSLIVPDNNTTQPLAAMQQQSNEAKSNHLPERDSDAITANRSNIQTPQEATLSHNEGIKDNYATEALKNIRYASYNEEEETDQERKGLKNIIRKANRIYNKVTHPEPDKTIFRFAKTEIGIPR